MYMCDIYAIYLQLYIQKFSPAEFSLWLSHRRGREGRGGVDGKGVGGDFSCDLLFLKKIVQRGIPVNSHQLHIWPSYVGCYFYE